VSIQLQLINNCEQLKWPKQATRYRLVISLSDCCGKHAITIAAYPYLTAISISVARCAIRILAV